MVVLPRELYVQAETAHNSKNLVRRLSRKETDTRPMPKLDENDERLHEIHNAGGMFSCFCSVCYAAS